MKIYLTLLFLPPLLLSVACTPKAPLATRWKPGSSDLLFFSNRDGNGEIYLLPANRPPEETEWVNLTHHPEGDNWPVWSPDGTKIAFQSRRGGSLDVWVMQADGSEPTRLTDHPEPDYLPSWTPDGQWITFTSWRVEEALGDTERSPHIYIMRADGSEVRRLVTDALGTSAGASWAPDGQSFVYGRKVGEAGADLFLADREGREIARLTEDDTYYGSAIFSPDGSQIAGYADDGSRARLFLIQTDGGGLRFLDIGPTDEPTGVARWYPRWSPDGRWLLYTGTAGEGGTSQEDLDLFAVEIEGGDGPLQPVRLITGPGREAEGSWRPAPPGLTSD